MEIRAIMFYGNVTLYTLVVLFSQWRRSVVKIWGWGITQVKPSNCFRRLEKIVLPSIFYILVFHPWWRETCGVIQQQWKKRSEETQTLRAGCSKVEPKKFAPPQTPFPGARDGQNLISWRWSLPLPTNPVWWGSMHGISSYGGNRPTHPHTNTPITDPPTGPITIHCAAA